MAWIKQADSGYVKHYTLESLKELCAENKLDTSECKVKSDYVQLIQDVPEFKDIFKPASFSTAHLQAQLNSQSRRKKLENVVLYDEKIYGSIDHFLDIFEHQAEFQGFSSKDEWSLLLEPLLSGAGSRAFSRIGSLELKDWDTVKSRIEKSYGISRENFREKFRRLEKSGSMTFEDYVGECTNLVMKWWEIPADKVQQDVNLQKILESVVIEQLLSIVRDDRLREKLRDLEAETHSLKQLAQCADRFAQCRKNDKAFRSRQEKGDVRFSSRSEQSSQRVSQTNQGSLNQNGYRQNSRGGFSTNRSGYTFRGRGYTRPGLPNVPSSVEFSQNRQDINPRTPNLQIQGSCSLKTKVDSGKYVHICLNGIPYLALLDSGAACSMINTIVFKELGFKDFTTSNIDNLNSIDGSSLNILGKVSLAGIIANKEFSHDFNVMEMSTPVLLGRELIQKLNLVYDLIDSKFWFKNQSSQFYPIVTYNPVLSNSGIQQNKNSEGENAYDPFHVMLEGQSRSSQAKQPIKFNSFHVSHETGGAPITCHIDISKVIDQNVQQELASNQNAAKHAIPTGRTSKMSNQDSFIKTNDTSLSHCSPQNDLYPKQEPINAPEELDSSTGESHCAIEQIHSDNSTYANSDFSKLPFVSLGRSGPGILGARIKAPISSMRYGRRII